MEQDAVSLIGWYRKNKRSLPWRDTGDPEDVWISEIMLQQTRVEAVKEYFIRFREALPDAAAIAACPDDRLMKLWEGLGYYSRARNLKKCAQVLVEQYGGKLPADHGELLKLPGIGPYTAGAIASIAFGLPVPAVDGHVLRVWARITGCTDDIALDATKRLFTWEIAALLELMSRSTGDFRAGDYNQALMELGATVCVPNGAPLCGHCPMNHRCEALSEGLTGLIPVKSVKKPRRREERTILVIRDGERFFFRKRPSKGLLAGLYEFPGAEGFLTQEQAVDAVRALGFDPVRAVPLPAGKHIFTHIEWHMEAWEVRVSGFPAELPAEKRDSAILVTKEELSQFAVPSAFRTWTEYYALKD